ncbi:DNA cytosine methyltransferase [Pontiella agarivorans]|uniref:Cytosine-specific methyltransferase n=1 Tax=Pontiella agarivorans TaxID=3038953 RepID=A0ABU5MVQ0_9BACT|nr:DNA (cytosine-5-)-methyltransferase [Pontiella agarivorans]MDZ8118202.1 DNA (cytosine-5-)-methyltransferase [Pontiella agarivorans]
MKYKLAELFCGPGGLGSAAKKSIVKTKSGNVFSIDPIWANDIDRDTCDTYLKNIHGIDPDEPLKKKDEQVICGDVRKVDFEQDVPDFDALAFGFPCNDFSIVGEQKGVDGSYGPLYTNGVKAINAKNPDWFLAENVGGLRNANDGQAFIKILCDLIEAGKGYNLSAHLYKFEKYGVPQTRHRVIIIGIRKDLEKKFIVPAITTESPVSAKEALESPPIPEDAPNQELTRQSTAVVERLKMLPPDKNAWFIDELRTLDDDSSGKEALVSFYKNHPEIIAKVPDVDFSDNQSIREKLDAVRLNVKSARMSQIYRRLDPSRPAYTITGSGGGGTHGYHWAKDRALTNRERARIQTFDDDHFFCGSKESIRKQIGMAVPPKGAKVIFEAVLKTMAGESYSEVKGGSNIGDFETVDEVLEKMGSSTIESVARDIT